MPIFWRASTATEIPQTNLARGAPMSDRDSVTVAIVGAGEMGAAVGRRLRESGARVRTSLAGRSAESVARVRDAGLEVVNDDESLVRDANFVLSIVPPGVAVDVAERL